MVDNNNNNNGWTDTVKYRVAARDLKLMSDTKDYEGLNIMCRRFHFISFYKE